MRGQRPTDDQIAHMREMRANGATTLAISREFPFAEKTILRHVGDIKIASFRKLPTPQEVAAMVEAGKSRHEIARQFDVCDSAVCNALRLAKGRAA